MRLLLDTHIFLWYITGEERLPTSFRRAIEDSQAAYLSVVSLWEATIKYQLGKLPLPEPPHPWLSAQGEKHGIESLPLDQASVARLSNLALHHRDPFDRMLVCQALEHELLVVTLDSMLSQYPVQLLSSRPIG
jgi:PIN domain nuclease of toxin-antitoxin system